MTRTEAFLHWAHDHPQQVYEITDREIERDVLRLIEEEKQLAADSKKPGRYKGLSDDDLWETYGAEFPTAAELGQFERLEAQAAKLPAAPF